MGEEQISLGELLSLVLFLGAPAYLLVIAIQLHFLRRLLGRPMGRRRSIACSAATLALAIPLSLVAWRLLPAGVGERYVQILNFLFLPALIGGIGAAVVTSSIFYFLRLRARNGEEARARSICLLLTLAAMQVSCAYAFSGGSIPALDRPTRATKPVGIAYYSLTVHDSKFDHQPPIEAAFEDALVRVLDETGLFAAVRRNDSDLIQLVDGDLQLDAEVTIEQSGNTLPHRILSIVTIGAVPMWGLVRQTLRGSVRSANRQGGPYLIEDEQTLVIWLPLAVVSIPDVYCGALTGKGNSMERLDRNLFRNFLAAARRDGLVEAACCDE